MSVNLGILQMQVLWLLSKEPQHGYALLKTLSRLKKTRITQGTLYPALAALERAQLVKSRKAGARGKKVYFVTPAGRKALREACSEFVAIFQGIFNEYFCGTQCSCPRKKAGCR
ncbi:MAG: PadR family transcriptional regulator [Candidatus Norongarragalinales archaeon]